MTDKLHTSNPLLSDWEMPPFDQISLEHYEPAIAEALAEAEAHVQAITRNVDAPTFANTVEVLECADKRLGRIVAILYNLNECCTSDEMNDLVMRVEPQMVRFSTRVYSDPVLFARIKSVYDQADSLDLDTEQRTLLNRTYRGFVRHGALLEGEALDEYRNNNEELALLSHKFSNNATLDTHDFELHLTSSADLEGLPTSAIEAARAEAQKRGKEGWVFTLSAPSYIPFMAHSTRADLRERMYRAYGSIGGRGNDHDNNAIIRRIVALRARQAQLLGFGTYCDYVVADRMVESRSNLEAFMQRLRTAVLPMAQADLADMQQQNGGKRLQPWDVSLMSEQLRREHYHLDSEALRPYFALPAVLEGVFGLYRRLYGLHFVELHDQPVYHPEVRVFRVEGSLQAAGHAEREGLGILYLDLYPRQSKRSGAWMTEFRGQCGATRPQIQVVCNFSRPIGDEPALLLFSEVETFMHEMGHAMHGMLSQVRYESLSGTNVLRDFVEMPSQLMENWCYEPDFLATFARHYQTGELLPAETVSKIRAAQNHLAGWLCLRQLNLGFTDLAFHTMKPGDLTPQPDGDHTEAGSEWKAEHIEAEAMTNLVPRVEGCCTATNFNHIFGGGYAAGYYGYKWAEVLDADIFSRYKADGIFNTATAAEFRRTILSRGGTEHPAELFRHFMHRNPDPDALLRRMGIGR